MHVVAVDAPIGPMELAPITSLAIHTDIASDRISAFWTDDDQYVVRAEGAHGVVWYRIDTGEMAEPGDLDEASLEARTALGALLADIIPLGGGRVAFPVGSTGRRTYRVWRGAKGASGRTRILGVRAARSRRLPA
ncbi:hypothetical protein [Gemmatimonas phototrophica]|jgi:hypothetical protein|uniref:hypothetical protein n=1 Tax=Gemmatimonas phototrophica TaxID=1379270 RepID=UPI0011AE7F14|nr:hypothetical protein [Gemmatimonas phototrophica]